MSLNTYLSSAFFSANWWWKQRGRMVDGNKRINPSWATAGLQAEIKGEVCATGKKQTWSAPYVQDVHFHCGTCIFCPAIKQINKFCSDNPYPVLPVLCPEEVAIYLLFSSNFLIYQWLNTICLKYKQKKRKQQNVDISWQPAHLATPEQWSPSLHSRREPSAPCCPNCKTFNIVFLFSIFYMTLLIKKKKKVCIRHTNSLCMI